MWRTVGFLISFGVVVELCTLVSFVVIVAGGVQRRVQGWGVVVGVLIFSAVIQGAGMAIVVRCPRPVPRRHGRKLTRHSLTSSITTHDSFPDFYLIPPGPCAPHPGRSSSSQRWE